MPSNQHIGPKEEHMHAANRNPGHALQPKVFGIAGRQKNRKATCHPSQAFL